MKVVVIGAGIVGVSAAGTLARHGADVTVLERGAVAGEASGLNAGVIGGGGWGRRPDLDQTLRMGSRDRYVELAEGGHRFDLDTTGTLTLVRTDEEWSLARTLVQRSDADGRRLELLDIGQLVEAEPSVDRSLLGAVLDPLGARAEPVAATRAMAADARSAGATIETDAAVTGLTSTTGGGWEVTVEGQPEPVGTDAIILAAGPWNRSLGALAGLDVPIVAVRGQMWASAPQAPKLRHAIAAAESTLAWSDDGPAVGHPPELTHHGAVRRTRHLYGRQRPNGEIVFGGDRVLTDDLVTGKAVDPDGIAVNHAHVAELLPLVADLPPARSWAGLMPFSLDGRPLLGPVPERPGLFLAGGLASSGFGRGPLAGQLVAEAVLGRELTVDLAPALPAGRVSAIEAE